jgi:hypothetical protein
VCRASPGALSRNSAKHHILRFDHQALDLRASGGKPERTAREHVQRDRQQSQPRHSLTPTDGLGTNSVLAALRSCADSDTCDALTREPLLLLAPAETDACVVARGVSTVKAVAGARETGREWRTILRFRVFLFDD